MESSDSTSICDFGNYTSQFNYLEEKSLRFNVTEVDSIDKVVPIEINPDNSILEELRGFVMEDVSKETIFTFDPSRHPEMTMSQKKFLGKLKRVVVNNDITNIIESNFERYIDEMISFLYDSAGFDDGEGFVMQPCQLSLQIKNETFAAQADREGRRGTEIVWVMCEDKHRASRKYKKGEVQLISCMVAAMQWNTSVLDQVYPPVILGIRVVGDCLSFYSARVTSSYLADLQRGLPRRNLDVTKFPKDFHDGLPLSNPRHRKTVLECITYIKTYAQHLTPVYPREF